MAPPIRTGSLRVVEDAPRIEDFDPIAVDVPSDEIAPGVSLKDGALHIENGDGSTTIDFDPKPEAEEDDGDDFYANLVNRIETGKLDAIAADLLDGIKRDIDSRTEWMEIRARGIQLMGLKLEEPRGGVGMDSAPLEGMSTVRHPLLLEATVNFQATARGELLPASGPVKVRNDTPRKPPTPDASAQPSPQQPGPMPAGGGQMPPPGFPQQFAEGGAALPSPTPAMSLAMANALSPQQQGGQPQQPWQQQQGKNPAQDASPFATELAVPPSEDEEKDTLADALETDFNHYLTVVAREYVPDTDRMLFYVGAFGDGFKKVYNCPLRRRPVSESVDAEDLIVSNSATDLSNCGRITHKIKMRKSVLKRMQILGVYADVDLAGAPQPKSDPVAEQKQEIEGYNPHAQKPEDKDHELYESYCELDLDEFAPDDFKGKGLPLPYRVTIETTSRKILSVIRNWEEDDEQALPKQFFVQFPFLRGLGFYGYGFTHLLGNTTSTLTAMWREMTDAGMFSNFPGFLFSKSAGRQLSNQIRVPPGGGMAVDVMPGTRLQDSVMPIPYKEPGGGFTAFAQWVEAAGQRLGQTGQIAVGEGKQDVPVGTTLALIEQATKIINSAHKRLYAAQTEEFQLLKARFKEDPEAFWRYNNKPAIQWQKDQFLKALDDCNLTPVADPNNPTSLHRSAKAQIIEALASKYPAILNQQAALKRVFRVAGIDAEGLFHPQPLPPPPDPRMVAISEKTKSTQDTVQAQTQAATAKAIGQLILGLKQVEQKQSDAQSRATIDQARLMLEATERRNEMLTEQLSRAQEMQHEKAKSAQELMIDHARSQQEMATQRMQTAAELEADKRQKMHELGADMVSRAHEGQMEQVRARHDIAAERERHQFEMQRDREKHQQQMAHDREMHEAKLAQERALARIKPKGQFKTTQKTTKSNPTGTKKTETTKTTEG